MADNEIIKYRGTNVADPIVPFTSIDEYPTHLAEFGKGGFRTVEAFDDLDNISPQRLEPGMAVFVKKEQKTYQYLKIGVDPNTEKDIYGWKKGKLGGGGVEVVEDWNALSEEDKEDLQQDGTIIYVVAGSEINQQGEGIIYPDQFFYYAGGTWNEYGQIYVGPIEPRNKNAIWIDNRNQHYDESNEILCSVQKAIVKLQEQVSTLMTLRTHGIIAGNPANSVRTDLICSTPAIKPQFKIEAEAQSFIEYYYEEEVFNSDAFKTNLQLIDNLVDLINEFLLIESFLEINGDNTFEYVSEPEENPIQISFREYLPGLIFRTLSENNNALFQVFEEFVPGIQTIIGELGNTFVGGESYQGLINYLEILAESSSAGEELLQGVNKYKTEYSNLKISISDGTSLEDLISFLVPIHSYILSSIGNCTYSFWGLH